jgi:hypothetical protein
VLIIIIIIINIINVFVVAFVVVVVVAGDGGYKLIYLKKYFKNTNRER